MTAWTLALPILYDTIGKSLKYGTKQVQWTNMMNALFYWGINQQSAFLTDSIAKWSEWILDTQVVFGSNETCQDYMFTLNNIVLNQKIIGKGTFVDLHTAKSNLTCKILNYMQVHISVLHISKSLVVSNKAAFSSPPHLYFH